MASLLEPPITTHAKLNVEGSATHAEDLTPSGSSGPWTQLCPAKYKISVLFKIFSWSVCPPMMMMHLVDSSSDWMAQLQWLDLAVSKGGPSVQVFSLTS